MKSFSDRILEKDVPFARNNKSLCNFYTLIDEKLSTNSDICSIRGRDELSRKITNLLEKELLSEEIRILEDYKYNVSLKNNKLSENIDNVNTTLNNTLELLVKENIVLCTNNENVINDDVCINGVSELVESVEKLIADKISEKNDTLLEKYKAESTFFVNHTIINNRIKSLKEKLNDYDLSVSPNDVFSEEEYEQDGSKLIINKISESNTKYFNIKNCETYFESGNEIEINFDSLNDSWEVNFVPNFKNKIGTFNDKKMNFMLENSEFISDFMNTTENIVGKNKIIK